MELVERAEEADQKPDEENIYHPKDYVPGSVVNHALLGLDFVVEEYYQANPVHIKDGFADILVEVVEPA